MTEKTMEDYFFAIGIAALPCFGLLAFYWMHFPHLPCLFHEWTGYYCPGCGGTRAVEMLLRGRFLRCAYYHPAVAYGAVVYLAFMLSQGMERISRHRLRVGLRYRDGYAWCLLLVVVVNFMVKNYLHFKYGFVL